MRSSSVAAIIPCFRCKDSILSVLDRIGSECGMIVVVDDACPDGTGAHVVGACHDPRVTVIKHETNQGVGGAVLTGYGHAAERGADIMVKLDGDGQMDPALIPDFIEPIRRGLADYAKGNRFFNIDDVKAMPIARLFGNAVLSFMTKASSGYWAIFDPTNGFTAISTVVYRQLPRDKIARRYFFESDMLFRLGTIGARVIDVPMAAFYGNETSGLRIGRVVLPFLRGHVANICKRIFYCYFLRDFSVASLELIAGSILLAFGTLFGLHAWVLSVTSGVTASTGTVMLAALPVLLGVQLLLSFLAYDMSASRTISPTVLRRAGRDGDRRDLRLTEELRDLAATMGSRRDAA